MPRTVKLPDGRSLTVPDDATMEEILVVANEMDADTSDQGPPEPSVMDERGYIDKAVDWLPSVGGAVGGFLGGKKTPIGIAAAGVGGALGEGARQGIRLAQGRGDEVPDTAGSALKRIAVAGGVNAGQELGGRALIGGLSRIAPAFMDAALGAQKVIRKKFPTVDLPRVALRERAVMGSDKTATKIAGRATAATAAKNVAARQADAAGHEITLQDVMPDLHKLRTKLIQARDTEGLAALDDYITRTKTELAQPMSITESLARKESKQASAAGTLQGSPNPKGAGIEKQASNREQKAITRTLHDNARAPGVGPALTKSQELMALEMAAKNVPSPRITSQLSVPTYALRRTAASSPMLSRYGIAADVSAQAMQGPGARVPDALVRQMLLELLNQQPEE